MIPAAPLISVIVSTFRRDRSLCLTLAALLKQDWPSVEVIVVDQLPQHDEGTRRYLADIKGRIHYRTSDVPNLPAARNTGVRISRGDVIVFCDDDVRLPPTTLTQLARTYSDKKVDGVTGFVIHEQEPSGVVRTVSFPDLFHVWADGGQPVSVCNFSGEFMSFRREVFDDVGYFDEWMGAQPMAMAEDFEFTWRLHVSGRNLVLDPAIRVLHEPSLSGGCDKIAFEPEERQLQMLRMRFYSYLKNRQGRGKGALATAVFRCARSHILNRSFFAVNPRLQFRRLQQFGSAMRFALANTR